MPKQTEPLNDRSRLEASVAKLGRAYDDLVKVVEKSSELSEEDIRKTFHFVVGVQQTAQRKAELSLATAKAANGGFSLDQEYAPPVTQPTLVASHQSRRERIVGDRGNQASSPAIDDDVDFIEE